MSGEGGDTPQPGQEAGGEKFLSEKSMNFLRAETNRMGPEGVKKLVLGKILERALLHPSATNAESPEAALKRAAALQERYTTLSNKLLVDHTHYGEGDDPVTFDREGWTNAYREMLEDNPDIAQPLIENFKRQQQKEDTDH